jgi:leucyl aminopeptidase
MKINLLKALPSTGSTLVVFATSTKNQNKKGADKKTKEDSIKIHNKAVAQKLMPAVQDKSISAAAQTITQFRELNLDGFRHVTVCGLGSAINKESIRRSAAELQKALSKNKTLEAFIDFDGISTNKKQVAEFLQAWVEGCSLSAYEFNELKSKKEDEKKTNELLLQVCSKLAGDASVKKAFLEASVLSECVNFSRRLGDMPGNLMNPSILAQTTVDAAKGTGLKVTVWDKARIKKEKMGGLLGVSNGSDQEPRFIIMEYKGAASSKKPIVFVGKGLTFDSGGISIKPGAAMEEMKYDMCGGANVIGTLLAIAKLKLKVNAVGLVPATENMPGPSATKPGDVHFARNGKSFEINNTDAEGRLILSDALCYASELKPEMIVDAATLTGAMVVALSNIHTGYFTKNSGLKNKIEKAAQQSGELVWQMPLTEEHTKDMKGTFADLSNISSGKGAGSATAAAFLEQFVEAEIPWAHFDIAGTAWAVGNRLPWCTGKGASGVLVRTFVELAKQF